MTTLTYDINYNFYSHGGDFNSITGTLDVVDYATTNWDLTVSLTTGAFFNTSSSPSIGSDGFPDHLSAGNQLIFDFGPTFQNSLNLGPFRFFPSGSPSIGVVSGTSLYYTSSEYQYLGTLHVVPMPLMGSGTLSLVVLAICAIVSYRRRALEPKP